MAPSTPVLPGSSGLRSQSRRKVGRITASSLQVAPQCTVRSSRRGSRRRPGWDVGRPGERVTALDTAPMASWRGFRSPTAAYYVASRDEGMNVARLASGVQQLWASSHGSAGKHAGFRPVQTGFHYRTALMGIWRAEAAGTASGRELKAVLDEQETSSWRSLAPKKQSRHLPRHLTLRPQQSSGSTTVRRSRTIPSANTIFRAFLRTQDSRRRCRPLRGPG